jgi:hypothetical protein
MKDANTNANALALMEEDAGAGVSTRAEDNVIPYIYILQAQSPQAIKGNKEKYIKGAEGGSIWLRGTKTLFEGGEDGAGILVLPCYFGKEWVEWKPNRGGFVTRHVTPDDSREPPRGAVQKTDAKGKSFWALGENIVNQSRVHVVLLIDEETMTSKGGFVISMSGSNHSASKNWMGLINSKVLPSGKTAPSYGYLYRAKTIFRSNDDGDWYMWNIEDAGEEDGASVPAMASSELIAQGRKVNRDFSSGAIRAEEPEDESLPSGGGRRDHGNI